MQHVDPQNGRARAHADTRGAHHTGARGQQRAGGRGRVDLQAGLPQAARLET